ncbi:hypothetical protein SAMN04489712_10774 [Thermomonospora echinospora]|uniref:Uncharacterized protein n=2 Tax=Thermomonospora echinospora TaxID=1992 RepID=A0A1H6BH16_9ACTN|nr:hypothetical protein SAMN04489712_10774 [Thermomonospora echinospora]
MRLPGSAPSQEEATGAVVHYRTDQPVGLAVLTLLSVAAVVGGPYALARELGAPQFLVNPAAFVLVVLYISRFATRSVTRTAAGRLTVQGHRYGIDRRYRAELDVHQVTAIHRLTWARLSFGSVRIHGDGGMVKLRPTVRCVSKPKDWIRQNRVTGAGTDLQKLVYRMLLINPSISVKGIAAPLYLALDGRRYLPF